MEQSKSIHGKPSDKLHSNMEVLGYDDEEEAFVLERSWLSKQVEEHPELYSKYRIRALIDMENAD